MAFIRLSLLCLDRSSCLLTKYRLYSKRQWEPLRLPVKFKWILTLETATLAIDEFLAQLLISGSRTNLAPREYIRFCFGCWVWIFYGKMLRLSKSCQSPHRLLYRLFLTAGPEALISRKYQFFFPSIFGGMYGRKANNTLCPRHIFYSQNWCKISLARRWNWNSRRPKRKKIISF